MPFWKEKSDHSHDSGRPSNDSGVPPLPQYTQSAHQAPPTRFQTRFASLSLHQENRVRFLHFPQQVINLCRDAIRATWPKGIDSEQDYAGAWEIKTNGHPWGGFRDQSESSRVVCAMLKTLHEQGRVMTLTTDVTKKEFDKDTLVFRHQAPAPAPCDWFSVAFSKYDRLTLQDAPHEVHRLLIDRLQQSNGYKVEKHGEEAPGIYELNLNGNPWVGEGKDTVRVRELVLTLIETLDSEGWTVYASMSQKTAANGTDNDTWYCCRPKGWTGAPVYHN
ncbi:hypothetical protein BDV95DRAFT_624938 [Massariosphaeria phaeospora]|uniref:Uncharacterized protein n=1 Tax=Massariosphaeria phaeospora TaxID=100035 RepID=A0A7C8MIV2_9PLEO|nr:hypothetical protein BDV95DRAFT_624938 [Massariosphaeria phaeospora]